MSSDLEKNMIQRSRILYVEPNDVYEKINGIPITPDYTDLCVSFNLTVETVPRTGYISGENNVEGKEGTVTYHMYWTSYNNKPEDNNVSFIKGDDYMETSYLTTYYTDINFNDFSKRNVVEGLGVESITVSFESYYVPTIKMRFIDVRGASFFGREEASHMDDKITQDSIWGCFFTFPYPKFSLQIKGFYGHPITYQLTCSDFRANFNSNTGNFEIDVTFIGYDYGLMADIPTAYLLAAPYSKYVGEQYWNEHVLSEAWKMTDGNPPKKLFEIMNNIKSAMRYADTTNDGVTVSDGDDGSQYTNKLEEKNAVYELQKSYNEIVGVLTDTSNTTLNELYKFWYKGDEYYMFNSQNNGFWENIKTKAIAFYKKANSFKSDFPTDGSRLEDNKLVFGKEITEADTLGILGKERKFTGITSVSVKVVVGTDFISIKPISINTKDVVDIQVYGTKGFEPLNAGWLGLSLDSKDGYQIIPCGTTEALFTKLSSELETYKDKQDETYTEEQTETDSYFSRLSIYKMAGIVPTIENVFKTIMCHLETFVAMVYECKNNIDRQITGGLRTPEKLGIQGFGFQDVTGNPGEIKGVPPWVAVSVREDKSETGTDVYDSVNTIGWVGNFEGETEWEEAKLINGLSLATLHILSDEEEPKYNYNGTASIQCLPSDVFSDVFPSEATTNPKTLGEYLGIRASAMFGVVGYKAADADALGKADALNLYSKIGKTKLKTDFINRNGWIEEVKTTAAKQVTDDAQISERTYTTNPGCEHPNARILTEDKSGKYRYTYSEAVLGRSNAKPNGEQFFGMVPVVEGGASTIFGTESSPRIFVSESKKYRDAWYRDVRATYMEGTEGKVGKIYHRMDTKRFLSANGIADVDEQGNPYNNETMFNIYGGSDSSVYKKEIEEQSALLGEDTLTIGTYEDKDNTWRNSLKEYWNINKDVDKWCVDDLNVSKYKWTVGDGTSSTPTFENIFLSPLYYAQNEASENLYSDASKSIMFLASAGYDINKVTSAFSFGSNKHIFESIPYGAMLLLGGLVWRARQMNDCFVCPTGYEPFGNHRTNSPLSITTMDAKDKSNTWCYWMRFSRSGDKYNNRVINLDAFDLNVTNRLVKEFEYFLKNRWTRIRDKFEVRDDDNNALTYNSFKAFKSSMMKINMGGSYEKYQEFDKKVDEKLSEDDDVLALSETVIISRGTLHAQNYETEGTVTFNKTTWESYVSSFCSKLNEIAKQEVQEKDDLPKDENHKEEDLKLAMYMYIKRLWDRWFMMSNKEKYEANTYMQNFVFMDSFYRNIGSILHINCEKLYEALSNINGYSMLFQLLGNITTEHKCNFFAFPDFFGFGDDNQAFTNSKNPHLTATQKIADMFKPIPFSRKQKMETSNKFIVVLIYDQSENISDFNEYKNDDFDIFSHGSDNVRPATFDIPAVSDELADVPMEERRVRRYGYNIPSFGVSFGRQNNAIFKNINIGMTNPIATEQSINALSIIAEKGGANDKAVCFYGQDLFPMYNGYSYTCTIEMMGDAQIMPLMYFQLMNIPMFRGTYMINSVTHTMRPGDMTTTFKGTKLSRFALPFAKGWYTAGRIFVGDNGEFSDGIHYPVKYSEDTKNTSGNIEYKWNKNNAAMIISDGRGITRNKNIDTKTLCEEWQTTISVLIHTDQFVNGVQQEKTVPLKVNKYIAEEIKQIFNEVFRVKMNDGRYFAITLDKKGNPSLYAYNWRTVNNPKYPNTQKLSYHSYGIAIDINAGKNGFHAKTGTDDWVTIRTTSHPVVQIFRSHTPWGWGGRYGDYMHFSYFNGD